MFTELQGPVSVTGLSKNIIFGGIITWGDPAEDEHASFQVLSNAWKKNLKKNSLISKAKKIKYIWYLVENKGTQAKRVDWRSRIQALCMEKNHSMEQFRALIGRGWTRGASCKSRLVKLQCSYRIPSGDQPIVFPPLIGIIDHVHGLMKIC